MKAIAAAAIACTSLLAFGAQACETPSITSMPDGATASLNQMLAAQKDIKAYMAKMNSYLACIDKGLNAADDDATPEYKGLMNVRHNVVVKEMEAVANEFNKQLQSYNAAHTQSN